MATKKTAAAAAEPVKEEAVLEETVQEEAVQEEAVQEETGSEWDETIEMIVPRKQRGDEPSYYVCVNDRRFQIPADGKMQKLPKPVALVLQDSLDAEIAAEEFADSMPQMY